jgi:hypothetical protein
MATPTVTLIRRGTAGTADSGVSITASTAAIITNVVLSNKTANTRYVTLTIGGYSFCTNLQVPANGTVNFDARLVANPSDLVVVTADAASAVDFFISGVYQ